MRFGKQPKNEETNQKKFKKKKKNLKDADRNKITIDLFFSKRVEYYSHFMSEEEKLCPLVH